MTPDEELAIIKLVLIRVSDVVATDHISGVVRKKSIRDILKDADVGTVRSIVTKTPGSTPGCPKTSS